MFILILESWFCQDLVCDQIDMTISVKKSGVQITAMKKMVDRVAGLS